MILKNNYSKKAYVLTAITALFTAFIFIHSAMPAEVSSQESTGVLNIIHDLLKSIGIDLQFTELFIRKAAHFIEYFVLGCLTVCTFLSYNKDLKKGILPALYYCLLTPVIDETIQYFAEGRSAEVKDVLLDYSGAVFGIIVISIINKVISTKKTKQLIM